MLGFWQATRWVCPACQSGFGRQTRGLRSRPRARKAIAGDAVPAAETFTLTDGTTIRIQADRGSDTAPAATEPPPAPTQTKPVSSPRSAPPPPRAALVPSPQTRPKTNPKLKAPPSTQPTGPHDYNWYFETLPPTPPNKTHATTFFDTHGPRATLLRSIAQFRTLPETDVPEVAFIGRSNVGKSSLLNAVMGCNTRSLLARTSRTPGFTKTMNLYGVGPEGVRIASSSATGAGGKVREKITGPRGLVVVDMPGYGSGSLTAWGVEIMKYIQSRRALRRVFVLLDAEHGVKDKDRSILASLRLAGVSHQVILSKMDKLYVPPASEVRRLGKAGKPKSKGTVGALREKMKALLPEIAPPHGGAALGEILACSSETLVDGKRLGIDDVRFAVLKAVGLEGEERHGFTESKKKKTKVVDVQA